MDGLVDSAAVEIFISVDTYRSGVALAAAEEGADIIMIKPALCYLDIIREVKNHIHVPVSAYNISGEYAMLKAAAKMGWINEEKAIIETLTSMKRAGADLIATYFAKDAARLLNG